MQELIQRAMAHDEEAFSRLIELEMQRLYKTARAILNNDEDVADAIGDTVLTLWEKLDTLKDPRACRSFITKILVNKCNDILRGNARVFPADPLPERAASPGEYLNLEWKEALRSLDEKYRLILVLYYIEDFKTSEIAQILDLPEATVRTRLRRGRMKLTEDMHEKKTAARPISGKEQVIG